MGAIWMDPALGTIPIYMATIWGPRAAEHPHVAEGMLWRVVPPAQVPGHDPREWTPYRAQEWTPEAFLRRHLAAYGRMGARPGDFSSAPRDPWSADLRASYIDPARKLGQSFARAGDSEAVSAIVRALEAKIGELPAP